MVFAQGSGAGMPWYKRKLHGPLRWLGITLTVLLFLYVGFVIWRVPGYQAEQGSQKTVAYIQSRHITLNDVDGKHLPPPPDPKLVDATVAGIDANKNGIRDDVELAIFKKYPNSPYTRAAELQYALALQLELTQVSDPETFTVALWQESRAYFCLDQAMPNATSAAFDAKVQESRNFVLNTKQRVNLWQETRVKYMTTHSNPSENFCDVDAAEL
jgi:hypothetical protein